MMTRWPLPVLLIALGAASAVAEPPAAPPGPAPVQHLAREAPFPAGMQGRWIDAEDPATELVIAGGALTHAGRPVAYDFKTVSRVDGALTVTLGIGDRVAEDDVQRRSLTGLVLTPDGALHGYSGKVVSRFVRPPKR